MIGRMIAMKRLPALMLSVFLLNLLSLPATAENVTVDRGSVKKEVTLTVDASNMVDVTINWDDFNYTFDGKNFTATSETMPKITVKNNNSQNTIYVTPKFEPYADLGYSDMAFDMYFYEDGNTAAGAGTDLKEIAVTGENETTVFAVPGGNPLTHQLGSKTPMEIGNVQITISLNGTNP